MPEIVKMQLSAGISQFKCATIAEAEMLAEAGPKNILVAYQLNFSKANRFISLIKKYKISPPSQELDYLEKIFLYVLITYLQNLFYLNFQ